MPASTPCKNCSRIGSGGRYCQNCGQKRGISRLDPKTVFDDLISALFNSSSGLWFTITSMLFHPGKSMLDYIDGGRKKYQSPISYFVCSLGLYYLYKKFVVGSLKDIPDINLTKEDIGLLLNLESNSLFVLLLGMALIGWLVCGVNWGETGKRSFNFIESVVVFTFIYGTNFFIDPVVISLEIPFWNGITYYVHKENMRLVTDIPLIVLIAYMAFDFCRKAKISILRYVLTLIIGFLYYNYGAKVVSDALHGMMLANNRTSIITPKK